MGGLSSLRPWTYKRLYFVGNHRIVITILLELLAGIYLLIGDSHGAT